MASRAVLAARRLLDEFGLDDVIDVDIQDLVYARGVVYREAPLDNCEGRIVFGERGSAIITINSGTYYIPRKRFSIAHELGHYELGHRTQIHYDNAASLDYIKAGIEAEANEFASELLVPTSLFMAEVEGKAFSPSLIKSLSEHFGTSISSILYKYVEYGPHPVTVIYSYNGRVKFYRKSSKMRRRMIDLTNLSVPSNSVTEEWYNDHVQYSSEDIQKIDLNVWFDCGNNWSDATEGRYKRSRCYEHCYVSEVFNTVLTVVWED